MSHFIINGILYEMLIGIVKCIKGALTYEKMDKSINDNRWCSTYPSGSIFVLLNHISIIIFTIKIKMKRLNNMIKM